MTCFRYMSTSSLFLTGQLSSFETCAISFPISLFSSLQYSLFYVLLPSLPSAGRSNPRGIQGDLIKWGTVSMVE